MRIRHLALFLTVLIVAVADSQGGQQTLPTASNQGIQQSNSQNGTTNSVSSSQNVSKVPGMEQTDQMVHRIVPQVLLMELMAHRMGPMVHKMAQTVLLTELMAPMVLLMELMAHKMAPVVRLMELMVLLMVPMAQLMERMCQIVRKIALVAL